MAQRLFISGTTESEILGTTSVVYDAAVAAEVFAQITLQMANDPAERVPDAALTRVIASDFGFLNGLTYFELPPYWLETPAAVMAGTDIAAIEDYLLAAGIPVGISEAQTYADIIQLIGDWIEPGFNVATW
jgi:hypothetical protein